MREISPAEARGKWINTVKQTMEVKSQGERDLTTLVLLTSLSYCIVAFEMSSTLKSSDWRLDMDTLERLVAILKVSNTNGHLENIG